MEIDGSYSRALHTNEDSLYHADPSTCCGGESACENLTLPLLMDVTTKRSSLGRRRRRRRLPLFPCCCCHCLRTKSSSYKFTSILLVLLAVMSTHQQQVCAFSFPFGPKPLLSKELGCSPTLSNILGRDFDCDPFYFDPLGLATPENWARLRETELKAGRISMAALSQTMTVPVMQHFIETTRNPVKMESKSLLGPPVSALKHQILLLNGGITTNQVSAQDLIRFIGTCLVLELLLVMPEPSR
jgi:hypothetical protein